MRQQINDFLRRALGVEIVRVATAKERPRPLGRVRALRLAYLYDLMRQVKSVDGDIVECGVGYGRSLFAFCILDDVFAKDRRIYAFDSFEGFPEPTSEDEPERTGVEAGRYAVDENTVKRFLINSGVTSGFIRERVTFVKGFFADTVHDYAGRDIALLHLDCDLYQSYKDCLTALYPRVAVGGIVAFDEYQSTGRYRGARQAIDEYFGGTVEIIAAAHLDRYYVRKLA